MNIKFSVILRMSDCKKISNCAIRLAFACVVTIWMIKPSHAQLSVSKPLPSMEYLVDAMNQNLHKVSNFDVRWVAVTSTFPGFWGAKQEVDPRILIDGKEIHVQRSIGIFMDGKVFIDVDDQTIIPQDTLDKHQKFWYDREQGIGSFLSVHEESLKAADGSPNEKVTLNNGRPEGHVMGKVLVPFLALGRMQIAANASANSSMKERKAKIVGWENYHGLRCIKLAFGSPSSFSGYVLVCPERDYKIAFTSQTIKYSNPNNEFKTITERNAVEQFTKYGDVWMPSRVLHEINKTLADGQVKSLVEQFRVLDFQENTVDTDLLFKPLFSPGTRVYHENEMEVGKIAEVAGGDISALTRQLQSRDFSIFKEDVGDLSKP